MGHPRRRVREPRRRPSPTHGPVHGSALVQKFSEASCLVRDKKKATGPQISGTKQRQPCFAYICLRSTLARSDFIQYMCYRRACRSNRKRVIGLIWKSTTAVQIERNVARQHYRMIAALSPEALGYGESLKPKLHRETQNPHNGAPVCTKPAAVNTGYVSSWQIQGQVRPVLFVPEEGLLSGHKHDFPLSSSGTGSRSQPRC